MKPDTGIQKTRKTFTHTLLNITADQVSRYIKCQKILQNGGGINLL